ncbi:polysaccharide deacetylase family protein [Peribacillus sp. R9-11]|uniref:polysaccharide deacetylase family protein n=1 Tax=unclassified Peribacillus TaxID=2675266 RepID=UPI002868EB0C|nr:polysaccharide deacetylase family protein [Peribacillus sp. R9-11]WMX55633.1 polysaccharide deacetylase family protein [Peribacillus sp. R9-11]
MGKYRVLLMVALLGILILPSCSQGVLENIGTKTAAPIAEDNIEVVAAAENDVGQNSEDRLYPEQIDTRNWIRAESTVQLPILMYHSISEGNNLRVPREEFQSQMNWLRENDYYTLSPREAFLVLTENRMPSEKCVWLTFDDGYTDNYTEAFPILKEYNMKATVFMIGKSIEKSHHLTEEQMVEMSENGISIESHTINHLELNRMTVGQQEAEMVQSKDLFDRILQQDTTVLSYPVGRYNEESLRLSEEAGYKMAVTTEAGGASRDQGMHALHRVRISPGLSVDGFAALIENASRY